MNIEIIKLLKEAKKARQCGIFNDKYTVEACLTKVYNFVTQALQLALQSACSTCKGTNLVPTKRSIGFGPANAIMDECPDCAEGEFVKQTHKLLRKCDRSRYLQAQHLGASIWSNVVWKRLDRACEHISKIEAQNKKLQTVCQHILNSANQQIENGDITFSTRTIRISTALFTEIYRASKGTI